MRHERGNIFQIVRWWAMIELPVTFFSLTTGAPFHKSSQALRRDTQATLFRPCLHSNVIKTKRWLPPPPPHTPPHSWAENGLGQSDRLLEDPASAASHTKEEKRPLLSSALEANWGGFAIPIHTPSVPNGSQPAMVTSSTHKVSHSAQSPPNARKQNPNCSNVAFWFKEKKKD